MTNFCDADIKLIALEEGFATMRMDYKALNLLGLWRDLLLTFNVKLNFFSASKHLEAEAFGASNGCYAEFFC